MPRLQDHVRGRALEIRPIDLRWGVVKGASIRETLEACLDELARCRTITTMPYVVGIVGGRYGWTPKEDEFPADLRQT